tara:strand:+ start:10248 stop:10991 length:744 start_codon:yes stop_codon:yes gene_type:complete
MSKVRSDNISNRANDGAPKLSFGAEVPVGYGITGAGFVNVSGASTFSGNVTIGGTLTYEDVTNVDSVGVITARDGIKIGAGESISAVSGTIYYYGDGSNLDGVVSGVETKEDGTSKGTEQTSLNFTGATVSSSGSETTVAIAAAGIATNAYTGGLVTLDLSKDEHKVTATGITTITVTGGTEGDTHIVRVINSGTATVGFSTYFLFPSGATPSLPSADGAFSQISFQVNRVGAAGTQLFATAAVNFS